ncbi:hypothetical protein TWF506_011135 [Arthrobotrys conoides]|uniref:Uncharacterized protein n=1 Tax=Arthrobotrys conoides TaxID=74498 RepID=A0AAN8N627_9PEZI
MVCEYTHFNFPGCGCIALVPLRFCPEHLDPSDTCYEEGREAIRNPSRITMLFSGPAEAITLQTYERMLQLYKTPLLAKDPRLSSESQQQAYEELANMMMKMQKRTVDWHDGGKVKAGFHTKLTRYHVIYPSCVYMKIVRLVDEKYWPFAETHCIQHSDSFIEDKVNKTWTFAPRPQLDYFDEPFEHKFNAAIAVRLLKLVDKGDKVHRLIYDLPGCYPESYDALGKTYKPAPAEEKKDDEESESEGSVYSDTSHSTVTGGGHGKPETGDGDEASLTGGEDKEDGSEYKGSESEDSEEEEEELDPKRRKEGEDPAKKNNGNSKKNEQEHKVLTSTDPATVITTTTILKPKKKPAPRRKPKKDDDGTWKGSGEEDDEEEIEEGKGGKKPGARTSADKTTGSQEEENPKKKKKDNGNEEVKPARCQPPKPKPAGQSKPQTTNSTECNKKETISDHEKHDHNDESIEDPGEGSQEEDEVIDSEGSEFVESAPKKPKKPKKQDPTTTETKPQTEGSKKKPDPKKSTTETKKPKFNPTGSKTSKKENPHAKDEDEASTKTSPKGSNRRQRPKRGEEEPEFTGLRRAPGPRLDEIGSGLRLYRTRGRSSEPLLTTEELEQLDFPATSQTVDEIFDGWAQTNLLNEDL